MSYFDEDDKVVVNPGSGSYTRIFAITVHADSEAEANVAFTETIDMFDHSMDIAIGDLSTVGDRAYQPTFDQDSYFHPEMDTELIRDVRNRK